MTEMTDKCMMQSVLNVAANAKYHSSLKRAGMCTAGIATDQKEGQDSRVSEFLLLGFFV